MSTQVDQDADLKTDDVGDTQINVETRKRGRPKKDSTVEKPAAKEVVKTKKVSKVSKKKIIEKQEHEQIVEPVDNVESCDEQNVNVAADTELNNTATVKKFDFQEFITPTKELKLSESSGTEGETEQLQEPVDSEKVSEKSIDQVSKLSEQEKQIEQPGEEERKIEEDPKDSKLTANSTKVRQTRKASTAKKGKPAKEEVINDKEAVEQPITETLNEEEEEKQTVESTTDDSKTVKNSKKQKLKSKTDKNEEQQAQSSKDSLKSKKKTTKKQKVESKIDEVEKSEESAVNQSKSEEYSEDTEQSPTTSKKATDKMSKRSGKEPHKVISFNVNGVRASYDKGLVDYMRDQDADIFCLQEIKCEEEKMPEDLKQLDYHYYWNVPDFKDGYSGVATFTKEEPIKVTYDMESKNYEGEGRLITCEFKKFYLVNVYATNAGRKLPKLEDKRHWNEEFRKYLIKLDKKKPVIACGDFNCAHTEIDLANPKTNTKTAGFTPEEREDFTELLNSGFFDSFRFLNPDKLHAYTFWSYMRNARANNVGWRLDYFILSDRLKKSLIDNVINDDVVCSDHCPITLTIDI